MDRTELNTIKKVFNISLDENFNSLKIKKSTFRTLYNQMEVAKRGRPPKEVEQRLIEGMSKLSPLFLEKLEEGLKEGHPWALKIYANHTLPKNAIDFNIQTEKIDIQNIIRFVNTNPNEKNTE